MPTLLIIDDDQLLLTTFNARFNEGILYYPVNIAIPLLREKDKSIRDTINNIGTSFNALSNDQLHALEQAADILIHQDPCFQKFVRDVNGQPDPPNAPPCPSRCTWTMCRATACCARRPTPGSAR